jgi:hypothetical protein
MARSFRNREWTVEDLHRAVRNGDLTQAHLDAWDINGVRGDPHTGKVTLETNPNDIGQKTASVSVENDPIRKRTPQERVDSLMEKVGRGIRESGAGVLPERVIEEIRLEYKWQEGKDVPAEMVRAILAKYLHVETEKAEEGYNKTVTYSRPSYQ